jgi:hypothetical protein
MADKSARFADFLLACIISAILFLPSRRSAVMSAVVSAAVATGLVGLYFIPDFWWQLASRSLDSALASMSTSILALLFAVAYRIYRLLVDFQEGGRAAVKKNLLTDSLHAIVFGVCWWLLLFSYHSLWKIPHQINAEAESVPHLLPPRLTVPGNAYAHTQPPPSALPPLPSVPQAVPAPIWTKTSPQPTTIAALFAQDFPTTMKLSDEGIGIKWKDTGVILQIKRQLYLDLSTKEKFVGFYLPSSGPDLTRTPEACVKLARENAVQGAIANFSKNKMFFFGLNRSSDSLVFSKKVLIYHDDPMSTEQKAAVAKAFHSSDFDVQFMGPDYLAKREKLWQQQRE